MKKRLKAIFGVTLGITLMVSPMSFVYALAEETTKNQEENVKEILQNQSNEVSEEKIEVVLEAGSEPVITPSMTQEEIDAAILGAADEITVQAGNYSDKNLTVSGKTVRMLAGSETTIFQFVTLNKCTLELENDVSVNPQGIIVESEKSVMDLVDTTVNGHDKNLTVYCQNSGNNKPNAYALSAKGDSVVLNNLLLTVSGSNGDRGLLNINSTNFEAHSSNLQVSGNAGLNQWGSAGAPNICIGHDNVCETRTVLFDDCTVNASGSVHPYGDGLQVNKTTDPCTITFKSCDVHLDNNGGNGFMGQTSSDLTKKVILENTNLSASGNGTGQKGACIGFANADIELKNTDGAEHTFTVSDNYKLGIGANNLGNFTSINASGYTIVASGNGANVTGESPQPYGYGMYLTRDGSSFENCTVIAEKNGKDGLTVGGDKDVTFTDTSVHTVLNGSNGLVIDADTTFDNSTLLSSCNGITKGDEVDTTVNKTVSFQNTEGSIGNLVLNGTGTSDSSNVIASYDGESDAVTSGNPVYLLEEDGTITEKTQGDLCHHAIDWDQGDIETYPEDKTYGSFKAPCGVCGNDVKCEPLVHVIYDKNTEDAVTNMPDEITALRYSMDIPIDGKPVRNGYRFTGWYLEESTENLSNGNLDGTKPTVTLYAGWEKEKTSEEKPSNPEKPSEEVSKSPNTGTKSNIVSWSGMIAISLLGISVYRTTTKKLKS